VIQRQGRWLPALGRGQQGATLSVPDGKLRAIGHTSKAMTKGWGQRRAGRSQRLSLCGHPGRPWDVGQGGGVQKGVAEPRDTRAGQAQRPAGVVGGGGPRVLEVYRVGGFLG
jgi:hypothetical protein